MRTSCFGYDNWKLVKSGKECLDSGCDSNRCDSTSKCRKCLLPVLIRRAVVTFLPLERFLFQCARFSFLDAHSSLWSSSSEYFLRFGISKRQKKPAWSFWKEKSSYTVNSPVGALYSNISHKNYTFLTILSRLHPLIVFRRFPKLDKTV